MNNPSFPRSNQITSVVVVSQLFWVVFYDAPSELPFVERMIGSHTFSTV